MLSDVAHDYFQLHFEHTGLAKILSLDDIVVRFRTQYNKPERQLRLLNEYNNSSLRTYQTRNPSDSLYDNLQRYLHRMQELCSIIPSMSASSDSDFIVKILSGVAGVREFAIILYRPPATIQGFINDLKWATSKSFAQPSESGSSSYYTGRKQRGNHSRSPHRQRSPSPHAGKWQSLYSGRCLVCDEKNCGRDHSSTERTAAARRLFREQKYLDNLVKRSEGGYGERRPGRERFSSRSPSRRYKKPANTEAHRLEQEATANKAAEGAGMMTMAGIWQVTTSTSMMTRNRMKRRAMTLWITRRTSLDKRVTSRWSRRATM